MYRINLQTNNIEQLETPTFTSLKIRERQHLQEWIAKNPRILGDEPLLIIQKEFAGFSDTKERLDLLALDEKGRLVIIENKLDDTGRDVVWQALKYTSYCSSLTTEQIVNIYQSYLDAHEHGSDAKENILEFLGTDADSSELLLNHGESQRIFFVCNNYRKEVTSTVLWLLNKGVDIICFKASPYKLNEELFLDVRQIIPLPETKDFAIELLNKEREQSEKSKSAAKSEAMLIKFWSLFKQHLEQQNCNFLQNTGAAPYYSIGFWKGEVLYGYCIGRNGFRVEWYHSNDADKTAFYALKSKAEIIQDMFPLGEIIWTELEGKKASRVKFEMPNSILSKLEGKLFKNEENWDVLIKWFAESMNEFYNVVHPVWEKLSAK